MDRTWLDGTDLAEVYTREQLRAALAEVKARSGMSLTQIADRSERLRQAPALLAVVCLVCPGGRRRWDRVAWRGLWAPGPVYRGRGATGPGRRGCGAVRNRHNPG